MSFRRATIRGFGLPVQSSQTTRRPQAVTAAGLALLGLVGCSIVDGLGDFGKDVFDAEPTYLDTPGERIAEGEFRQLSLDISNIKGARFLTLRGQGKDSRLVTVPLEGGQGCEAPEVTGYFILYGMPQGSERLMTFYDPDGDGHGRLQFLDSYCKRVGGAFEDSEPYLYSTAHETGGTSASVLFQSGSALLRVSPSDGQATVLGDPISHFTVGESSFVLVENGVLVVYDSTARQELFRDGKAVTEVLVDRRSASPSEPSDYSTVFYVDQGQLKLLTTGESRLISPPEDKNLCELKLVGDWLFYLSPCAKRELWAQQLTHQVPVSLVGSPQHVDSGVTRGLIVLDSPLSSTDKRILYEKPDPKGKPALYAARNGAAGKLLYTGFAGLHQAFFLYAYALVEADEQQGKLVDVRADFERTLQERVARQYSGRVPGVSSGFSFAAQLELVNFDGTYGDLWDPSWTTSDPWVARHVTGKVVPRSPELVTMPTRVHPEPERYLWSRAVLHDMKGTQGSLRLSIPAAVHPEAAADATAIDVSSRAAPGRYRFFTDAPLLAWFEDVNATTKAGRLVVHHVFDGWQQVVAPEVTEVTEVAWGWWGLAYVVPSGKAQGLWTARLK